MSENLNFLLASILGAKKLQIIQLLAQSADENGLIYLNISDIMSLANASKPTVINTLSLLKEKGSLTRIKNGLYRLENNKF